METSRREKKLSSDSFSFPSTPTSDSEFEFGCLTPESPSSDPCIASPADHLFFNGRLLPHSFPFQTQLPISTCSAYVYETSRTTSRTSSVNSKDSFMSSRSNSTNSRSSCSSARTSSSDTSSERKLLHHQNKVKHSGRDRFSRGGSNKQLTYSSSSYSSSSSSSSSAQLQYGCSRRWQYITAVPSLSHESSRRSKVKENKTKKNSQERAKVKSSQFWRRFLKRFVSVCRECHALEPSRKKKLVIRENVK